MKIISSFSAKVFRRVVVPLLLLSLAACGGGGSGDNGGSAAPASQGSVITGSVGDGPVVGATVNIYGRDGNLLQTERSDSAAKYSAVIKADADAYPLTIEAVGGTDLVTNRAPDFTLRSVVRSSTEKDVNINPYTTFIVSMAEGMPGGLMETNLERARTVVLDQLNFGLNTAVFPDPISTMVTDDNIAVVVKSSEALGEMIRRARDNLIAAGYAMDGDDVVNALSADISDGVLDGQGGPLADSRIAAISVLSSAQVLVESLGNNLKVDGTRVTQTLDRVIQSVRPSVSAATLTHSVSVNRDMLEQARLSVAAARALLPGSGMTTVAAALDAIQEGDSPDDVALVLSGNSSAIIGGTISFALSATDTQLERANEIVRAGDPGAVNAGTGGSGTGGSSTGGSSTGGSSTGGSSTGGSSTGGSGTGGSAGNGGSTNQPPAISGTPGSSVVSGQAYSFRPTATDADGDALVFAIKNRPGWASFNAGTGRLSGSPADSDAGSYNNIVISVTDGTASRSLAAFSITVTVPIPPNSAPTISGSPATSVDEGASYLFRPSANDVDGDSLTFSIQNRPSWASFDSSTGRLSGTPGAADVGTYSNIKISVSDGLASVSLAAFSLAVNSVAAPATGSISLTWSAPVARADGAALAVSELDGYTIHYGTKVGVYPNSLDIADPSTTSATITDLPLGTYYIVVTARDTGGRESGYSNVATKLAR